MGKLNLVGAYDLIQTYTPHASVLPPDVDLTVGGASAAVAFICVLFCAAS
jgi:hypothetical protein